MTQNLVKRVSSRATLQLIMQKKKKKKRRKATALLHVTSARPKHEILIVMGVLNAKVKGKEEKIGKHGTAEMNEVEM